MLLIAVAVANLFPRLASLAPGYAGAEDMDSADKRFWMRCGGQRRDFAVRIVTAGRTTRCVSRRTRLHAAGAEHAESVGPRSV